ncbi:ribonuclease J [Fructilactobacillus cliffordii]|uniref:Ribonuclease J n=1 Tax=Fructilactobacillus cliffordii TaxID=2940299 RepID=A0A9Q9E380_9LACO|nr:ribonuclease J [Fructilactobacillus cliffordii]USS89497.1 ribonuclease J [Fructilactobacillus cliffordii]
MKKNVKVIPLGGVREEGKDLFAIEINGSSIFILDCGSKFPLDEMLGVDYVIPDFTYLQENADKIVGVFLTSGQLDSIGSLPYFLSKFDVPVFGTELTIKLAEKLVAKHKKAKKFNDFHIISDSSEIVFDDGTVSFFGVTHSIPDAVGIAIQTDLGSIVYTGDFKFDQTVPAEYQADYAAIAAVGKHKVLALLCDSRNAEDQGTVAEEQKVRDYLVDVFDFQASRIIVTCLADHLLRIQEIIDAAAATDRRIFFANDKSKEILDTALELGKVTNPEPHLFVKSEKELNQLNPEQVIILHIGQPGEAMRSLEDMASQRNPRVQIKSGDLVLLATDPFRSMDNEWAKTRDLIYQDDATVASIGENLNLASDATRSDIQMMTSLIHPEYFIPVQGEYHQLQAAADAVFATGFPADRVLMPAKGDVIEFDEKGMQLAQAVSASDTMIDGIGVGDIGNIVLRDRSVLAQDGVFIAVVTIDRKKKLIVEKPKVTSRGFIYSQSNQALLNEAADVVEKTVRSNLDNKEFDWGFLKQDVREKLSSFLYKKTDRRPVILPVVMEVNQHHRRSKNAKNKKKK